MPVLIHGRAERMVERWSRDRTISVGLAGPVAILVGMAAGKAERAHPWAFLLPLAGMLLGIALAEMAALSVLRNSNRWLSKPEAAGGPEESEHPDE
jgi:hypothetical protein